MSTKERLMNLHTPGQPIIIHHPDIFIPNPMSGKKHLFVTQCVLEINGIYRHVRIIQSTAAIETPIKLFIPHQYWKVDKIKETTKIVTSEQFLPISYSVFSGSPKSKTGAA